MTTKGIVALALAATLGFIGNAGAETYPTRPVRLIAPFGPGGAQDVVARLLGQKLTEQLGKPFYVENIVGAGGNIGTARVAQAASDGYTMLLTGPNHVMNPSMYAQVPYDPNRDFDSVTMVATNAVALAVFRRYRPLT